MGKHPSLIIAGLAIVAVLLVVALGKGSVHRKQVKCYFADAQGLRPGARVRLAGVEVGSVTSMRVRPELREHPAEVTMLLVTTYDLNVPSDAVVSLETAGLLGEVYPQINLDGAHGVPVADGGELKARTSGHLTTPQEWIDCFSNIAAHKPCNLTTPAITPKPEHK